MQPFIAIISILIGAYLLSKLARYLKIPRVAAYIALGLLLGMEPLNSLIIGDSFSTVSRLGDVALLSLMFFAGLKISPKKLLHETKEAFEVSFLSALIPFAIGFLVFYWLGYHPIVGLVVGVAMSISAEGTTAAVLMETNSMGHSFDFHSILPNIKLLIIIVSIAFLGKFIGAFLAKPFTTLSWLQLRVVGWAMNSRGAIELALALIAYRTGVIPAEIYSSLVLMALITTLAFPFAFVHLIKRHPKVMN